MSDTLEDDSLPYATYRSMHALGNSRGSQKMRTKNTMIITGVIAVACSAIGVVVSQASAGVDERYELPPGVVDVQSVPDRITVVDRQGNIVRDASGNPLFLPKEQIYGNDGGGGNQTPGAIGSPPGTTVKRSIAGSSSSAPSDATGSFAEDLVKGK